MKYIRYAFAVLRRLMTTFVVIPAGVVVVFLALIYHFSFYSMAHDGYEFVEQLVRIQSTSRPGYLTINKCVDEAYSRPQPVSTSGVGAKPDLPPDLPQACNKFELRDMSIDALAADTANNARFMYWLLVVLGVASELMMFGRMRFFLLSSHEVAAKVSKNEGPLTGSGQR